MSGRIKDPKIANYVDYSGGDLRFDTLTEEEKRRIAELLQDNSMHSAGYVRKHD